MSLFMLDILEEKKINNWTVKNQWLSCKNLILYDGKYSDNCPHGYYKNKKIK